MLAGAQESLGGNAKTLMIANVSPAREHAGESVATLAFAARAKCIRNAAVINADLRGEAALMRRELERLQRCVPFMSSSLPLCCGDAAALAH